MITKDEQTAIAALQRLAKTWPATLTLVHQGCSVGLQVKHTAIIDAADDAAAGECLANISIPAEACQ